MKRIQQESNVSCRVRGVNNTGNDREIAGAMELVFVTKNPGKQASPSFNGGISNSSTEDLGKAIELGKEIIDDIIRQHEDYVIRGEQMRSQRLGGGRGKAKTGKYMEKPFPATMTLTTCSPGRGMEMEMGDPRMEMGRGRGRGRGRGMHPGPGRGRGRGRGMGMPGPGRGHGPDSGRFEERPPPDFQPFDAPPFPPEMRGPHQGRDR